MLFSSFFCILWRQIADLCFSSDLFHNIDQNDRQHFSQAIECAEKLLQELSKQAEDWGKRSHPTSSRKVLRERSAFIQNIFENEESLPQDSR